MTAKRNDDGWAAATAAAHPPATIHTLAPGLFDDPQWTTLKLGFAFEDDAVRWQPPAHRVTREGTS